MNCADAILRLLETMHDFNIFLEMWHVLLESFCFIKWRAEDVIGENSA